MSFTQAIINRILELCEKNHITPNKLSELSTVPVATLFALLNDKVENPSSRNIYKMCKVFGITIASFMIQIYLIKWILQNNYLYRNQNGCFLFTYFFYFLNIFYRFQ